MGEAKHKAAAAATTALLTLPMVLPTGTAFSAEASALIDPANPTRYMTTMYGTPEMMEKQSRENQLKEQEKKTADRIQQLVGENPLPLVGLGVVGVAAVAGGIVMVRKVDKATDAELLDSLDQDEPSANDPSCPDDDLKPSSEESQTDEESH